MMRFYVIVMLYLNSCFFLLSATQDSLIPEWTWLYRKNFLATEHVHTVHKVGFAKEKIPEFTQLIFSWNALRPEKGYFSFFVQVRDAATQKWGDWHHMADWGRDVQKTYMSKSNGLSSYVYVRLELDEQKTADAFRIKIVVTAGASAGLLHGLSVATSNFKLFQSEVDSFVSQKMKTAIVSDVPAIAQFALDHTEKHRICSPISCAMLVRYIAGHAQDYDLQQFVAGVFDTGLSIYGSWPCNIAHAYDLCQGAASFCVRRLHSFYDIYQQLERRLPVIVSVRGTLPGALKPFPHGHLMVVIGWDSETHEVICHDPAAENHDMVLKKYTIKDFLCAWERSYRLAYIAETSFKKNYQKQI